MALGRQRERQAEMLVSWAELPCSLGHIFYDKLQPVLVASGFDGFVEGRCAANYAPSRGRPSLPPGRYFRMLLVGYFEGIDSERGLEWRCADSLSLREFLRLGERERVPDHSWLSRTRGRLPLEVHDEVFTWVLQRLAEHGLIKGDRIGVDASTMEANAALRAIVRRDSGEGYREMLARMACESGIETPTTDDLIRLDRKRKGKKLSNADWQSPIDPDARIAKMKDGRTHLAYKPEHAMDLDTGAVVAAEVHATVHPADQGDTTTMPGTLASAAEQLSAVDVAPTPEAPADLIADKGYHSRDGLKALDGGPWNRRISEPHRDEFSRWLGDDAARRAVYNNRTRLRSGAARQAFKLRAELMERGFALILDRGGMRRTWLRGRENVQRRYLIHVAGYNLGLIMRLLTGAGTPRQFGAGVRVQLFAILAPDGNLISSCWSPPAINPLRSSSASNQIHAAENAISQRAAIPRGRPQHPAPPLAALRNSGSRCGTAALPAHPQPPAAPERTTMAWAPVPTSSVPSSERPVAAASQAASPI
jgi:transposase